MGRRHGEEKEGEGDCLNKVISEGSAELENASFSPCHVFLTIESTRCASACLYLRDCVTRWCVNCGHWWLILGLNNPLRRGFILVNSRIKNLWRRKQGNCRCKGWYWNSLCFGKPG
jgi:hypothetical protein